MSSAYTKISQLSFNDRRSLRRGEKVVFERSLDQVREAITSCKQSIRKASKFGGRLEALLNEAVAVRNEWPTVPRGGNRQQGCQYCKEVTIQVIIAEGRQSFFCNICKINGHTGNRFCVPRRQVNMGNRSQQYSYRPTGNGGNPPRDNGTIRDNRPRNQIRGTARELVCFKCNQPGHWARECQSNLGPGQASNLGREENPFNYENRPGNSNRPLSQ
ncbi:hypothetical protein EVAR_102539_1 [Eumeta japonica]|uniref:CCHC-type domain-containing protein n=1 Tax=Eumeta variegata TaxID=151549 RepID=A0A4C1TTP5_EUMVA|nr:hypothetical protein EVAR_102539_1 [Eumeta japonica]